MTEATGQNTKRQFKPLPYQKQSEPITATLVQSQIDTNSLPDNLSMIAQQAARVQASLSDLDCRVALNQNQQLSLDAFSALQELRNYQKALVDLCIDGRLEPEKFAGYMLQSHDDFVAVGEDVQRESERLLVDDWADCDANADAQLEEEKKQAAPPTTSDPAKSAEAAESATSRLRRMKRDEFSYSLLEALQLHRQMLAQDNEQAILQCNKRVKEIFIALLRHELVTQQMAQEILDRNTVENLGMGTAAILQKLLIQYRTQTLYAQQKFNLMREECEGFAKLIIELNQEKLEAGSIDQVKENIQRLVGYFQLDPNRVLDLILSSFQNNVQNLAYLELVQEFGQRSSVTQLLGFKIQYALEVGKIGPDGLPTIDPLNGADNPYDLVEQNLFDLTAMLIKYQIVALEDIWPYIESKMDPKPAEEGDEIEQLKALQLKNVDYLYKLHDKIIMNAEGFKKEMEKQQVEPKHLDIEKRRAKMHCNFKVRLLQSCVRVNDWDTADDIVHGLYDGKFDLTWSRPLLQAISKALDWCVTKLYRQVSPAGKILQNRFGAGRFKLKRAQEYFTDAKPSSIQQATAFNEALFSDLKKILSILGVQIALDEKAFQKVLKVVQHAMDQNPQLKQSAIQLASEIFVPAQCLITTNFAIESAIWAIFKHADFNQRYTCYTNILKFTYLSQPILVSKQIEVYKKFNKWARRLVDTSDRDSRSKCKQFMRIAYGNCLLAFDIMVTNAKSYENQIEAQIAAIVTCQDLALDQMAFMIVKNLADTNDPVLDQNQNVAKWLMNLTDLGSQFFKKFSQVEITGLFTYLVHKLREENSFVLGYMINQIVGKMFGWTDLIVNQLQPDQLNVLSAGFTYMLYKNNQSQQLRSSKKSTEALQTLFWHPGTNDHQKIGMRMMVQMAQQAMFVGSEYDTQHLILVARQYDKMQGYFAHMVDTLNFLSQTQKNFARLLPENPAKSLSFDYRLPPQHVFQIMRCALPPIYKLTPDQFQEQVAAFKEVLDFSAQSRIEVAQQSENTQDNDYWDELGYLQTKKEDIWKHLKPELYFVFWYINIQSLIVPEKLYKDEIKALTDQIKELNNQITQLKQSRMPLDAMRQQSSNENPKELMKKNVKEVERLTKSQRDLQKENEFMVQQQKDTYAFLKQTIPDLFKKEETSVVHKNITAMSEVLIQHCFFPRLMHSAKDALFSFNFFKLLHKLRVPSFNFLNFFGQITRCIVPAIHFCSEDEAENLGIFFLELFKQLSHWSKKDVWERECHGYGGFAREMVDPTKCITLKDFDKIISTINKRISAAMICCFDENGKMQVKARCALIILNRVHPVFPNNYANTKAIQAQLQKLVGGGDKINQDLKTLAGRLNEKLKKKVTSFPEHATEQAKTAAAQDEKNGKTSSSAGGASTGNKDKNSSKNTQQSRGGGSKDTPMRGSGSDSKQQSSSQKPDPKKATSGGSKYETNGRKDDRDSNSRKVTDAQSSKKDQSAHDSSRKVTVRSPQGDQSSSAQQQSKPKAKAEEKHQNQRDKIDNKQRGGAGGTSSQHKPSQSSQPGGKQSSGQKQTSSAQSADQSKKQSNQGGREETKQLASQSASQAGSKRPATQSQSQLASTVKDESSSREQRQGQGQNQHSKQASAESFKDPSQANKRQRTAAHDHRSEPQAHHHGSGPNKGGSGQHQMPLRDNQSRDGGSGRGNNAQNESDGRNREARPRGISDGGPGKRQGNYAEYGGTKGDSGANGSSNQAKMGGGQTSGQQERQGGGQSRTGASGPNEHHYHSSQRGGGDHGRQGDAPGNRDGGRDYRDHHGGRGGGNRPQHDNRRYDGGPGGQGRDQRDGRGNMDRRGGHGGGPGNRSPRRGNGAAAGQRGPNDDHFSPYAGGHDQGGGHSGGGGGYHGGQSKYYGGSGGGGGNRNRKNN